MRVLCPASNPGRHRGPGAEVPHPRPETAADFCAMRHGSPPPLQRLDWMLRNWRLGMLGGAVRRNVQVLPSPPSSPDGWPVIAFSHVLRGSAEFYSYQTIALALAGYVVLVVEHANGSAPVVTRRDGTKLLLNATADQVRFVSFGVKRAPPSLLSAV